MSQSFESNLIVRSVAHALRRERGRREHTPYHRELRKLRREYKAQPKKTGFKTFMRQAFRAGNATAREWLTNKGL